jgi:hypothetical protein
MRYVFSAVVVCLAIFLAASSAVAHHPIQAKFDSTKPMTLSGTVSGIDWHNPHVHIFMTVRNGATFDTWAIELESIVDLRKSGWNNLTVKPGDAITVQGIAARDGSRQIWAGEQGVMLGNRRVMNMTDAARAIPNLPARPTPRGADGKPLMGSPAGAIGYWARPSSTVMVEDGQTAPMDEWGQLRNQADVDKVAPFQRWARDLYAFRQSVFLKDDPMYQFCKPPGGPRAHQLPYGVQFNEDPERKRIFVFTGSGNQNYRIIYMDGRAQRGAVRGDDDNPLYYGRSVAVWEGDTLVVDTKGFNEKFWMTNGGLPHTEQLHLIERYTRTDYNTMRYEVTIDDPGAYTRTWKSSWTLRWVPEELPSYFCQDNRP